MSWSNLYRRIPLFIIENLISHVKFRCLWYTKRQELLILCTRVLSFSFLFLRWVGSESPWVRTLKSKTQISRIQGVLPLKVDPLDPFQSHLNFDTYNGLMKLEEYGYLIARVFQWHNRPIYWTNSPPQSLRRCTISVPRYTNSEFTRQLGVEP